MDGRNRNARVCPKCGAKESRVYDSRVNSETEILERRRECSACGARWMTVEKIVSIIRKGRANQIE